MLSCGFMRLLIRKNRNNIKRRLISSVNATRTNTCKSRANLPVVAYEKVKKFCKRSAGKNAAAPANNANKKRTGVNWYFAIRNQIYTAKTGIEEIKIITSKIHIADITVFYQIIKQYYTHKYRDSVKSLTFRLSMGRNNSCFI